MKKPLLLLKILFYMFFPLVVILFPVGLIEYTDNEKWIGLMALTIPAGLFLSTVFVNRLMQRSVARHQRSKP